MPLSLITPNRFRRRWRIIFQRGRGKGNRLGAIHGEPAITFVHECVVGVYEHVLVMLWFPHTKACKMAAGLRRWSFLFQPWASSVAESPAAKYYIEHDVSNSSGTSGGATLRTNLNLILRKDVFSGCSDVVCRVAHVKWVLELGHWNFAMLDGKGPHQSALGTRLCYFG